MIIQFFFKFHDFSMHGTFGGDFQGFTELVGTCHKSSPCHFVTGQVKGHWSNCMHAQAGMHLRYSHDNVGFSCDEAFFYDL